MVFDHYDIYILANSLTINQLRREITSAYRHYRVEQQFEGTPESDWFPWLDYKNACQQALDCHMDNPQPALPRIPGKCIDIQAAKDNSDIVSVIESYGVQLLKSGHNRFRGFCPFHDDRRTPSFSVDANRQTWHCFGACGTGGDIISFIQRIENCGFKQAVAILLWE